ncbi:MAG: M20/M25/M40 family metallo-hydrolase [Segniliparus sp.]|uniref:M20/M25/M40 family metallo-hydrolase n=1 Tax=Segniliparus sp. TaxID=2804064 RepID=UPI003F319D6F
MRISQMASTAVAMFAAGVCAACSTSGGGAAGHSASAEPYSFRALYQELVETNTTLSSGDCTEAAEKVAGRLKDAGYSNSDVTVFSEPQHPKAGGLVAVLRGSDPNAKAIALLAHLDVVEAKREDWQRDPFKLAEEDGYYYGRGANDDKAQAAIWADSLIRYRQEGFVPKRSVKLVLTCGEESGPFNGAKYLAEHERQLVDAEFALNEGAGGILDQQGNRIALGVQAGEKVYQDFTFETTSPGGHSSVPADDNAIYRLGAGLERLRAFGFPIQLNDTTKAFFAKMADLKGGETAAEIHALLDNPQDQAAGEKTAKADPVWNSMLRTTCVATQLSAGHAPNALPQRATANVNCRIFPGVPVRQVQDELVRVVADPQVKIAPAGDVSPTPAPPPLDDRILGPARQVAGKLWPGVPLLPTMATGATDGKYWNAAGIPTYGLSGIFLDPDLDGMHGLDERLRVRSLDEGRAFLYEVVKLYANAT